MSQKVKLPKYVCDALDLSRNLYSNKTITEHFMHIKNGWASEAINKFIQSDEKKFDLIMQALVLGYEPELSAEDIIKGIYDRGYVGHNEHTEAFRHGIKQTLLVHGIHYDWLGDAE